MIDPITLLIKTHFHKQRAKEAIVTQSEQHKQEFCDGLSRVTVTPSIVPVTANCVPQGSKADIPMAVTRYGQGVLNLIPEDRLTVSTSETKGETK